MVFCDDQCISLFFLFQDVDIQKWVCILKLKPLRPGYIHFYIFQFFSLIIFFNREIKNPQVITLQPRDWNHGICDCFSNCGNCKRYFKISLNKWISIFFNLGCLAFLIPPIYLCMVASDINEPCWSCMFGGPVAMRTKIRTERKINVI